MPHTYMIYIGKTAPDPKSQPYSLGCDFVHLLCQALLKTFGWLGIAKAFVLLDRPEYLARTPWRS